MATVGYARVSTTGQCLDTVILETLARRVWLSVEQWRLIFNLNEQSFSIAKLPSSDFILPADKRYRA